jgi:hypothetical protein
MSVVFSVFWKFYDCSIRFFSFLYRLKPTDLDKDIPQRIFIRKDEETPYFDLTLPLPE